MDTGISDFVAWLEDRHSQIRAREDEALDSLRDSDINLYNEKMREKARILADLDYESKPLLHNAPDHLRRNIEHTLHGYSANAATALKLNSVFYMSALLYPDDHKKGEPDNMELFIDELKNS